MDIALLSPGLAGSFSIPALTSQMVLGWEGASVCVGLLLGVWWSWDSDHVIILPHQPAPRLETETAKSSSTSP